VAKQDEATRAMARLIARAWQDASFKRDLLERPMEVLRQEGIPLAEGVEYRVVENTSALQHLVLPAKPAAPDVESQAADESMMPMMTVQVIVRQNLKSVSGEGPSDDRAGGPRGKGSR
jgi:hypothetical protein